MMMDPEDTDLVELRKLVKAGVMMPLIPKQQERINEILYYHSHCMHNCSITTKTLQPLVEHNPPVAIDCLVRPLHSNHGFSYLAILNEMEFSLCSIEESCLVILDTIYRKILYIINCIEWCENTMEISMQSCLVRDVYVFLQSLIRNAKIDNPDIFIDIQSFCIGFSRIKEAVGLFELIKIT
jgi:hypothetical protein